MPDAAVAGIVAPRVLGSIAPICFTPSLVFLISTAFSFYLFEFYVHLYLHR